MLPRDHTAALRQPRARSALLFLAAVLIAAVVTPTRAPAQESAEQARAGQNPRWEPIRRIFGQGDAEGDDFRIELPRSDLHVRIGRDTLDPRFEFTSYVGFAPVGAHDVLAMGEVILRDDEVTPVLAEALRQGIGVTAVHNHLVGEVPRIVYVHVMAQGAPDTVARELRAVFARSATPLSPPREPEGAAAGTSWQVIDTVLGAHSEARGRVAEYVFPRDEHIRVHGLPVKSTGALETASEAVFQQLGGTRVASTGELYLLPAEVPRVLRALQTHGLHVTALHNHMLDDGPPHYWVHWYATGAGAALARGVAAALAEMHGARRAVAESAGG